MKVLDRLKHKINCAISKNEPLLCIGYQLHDFSLSDLSISKEFTKPVYFNHSQFFGPANFDDANFHSVASFANAHFQGRAYFQRSHFQRAAVFSDATLQGPAFFFIAIFQGGAPSLELNLKDKHTFLKLLNSKEKQV
jgi:uncharacterized protein YjbI with pentapeptide repeats